jgi:methylglutaconyl-CoA hydratase
VIVANDKGSAGGGRDAAVRIEREGPLAIIVMCRESAANALSVGLVTDLAAAFAQLASEDPPPAAIVLTGEGSKAFCAGADLKERRGMSFDQTRAFLDQLGALIDTIAGFRCPVIAALNGVAFGGGFELALACDLRVAADHINLGLPEVRLGIIPGAGGTQRLARIAGVGVAKELILTGKRIDATRAHALGLVSAVVPADQLLAAALAWGREIAEAGPLAVAQAKIAIDGGFGRPLGEGLAIERQAYEVVLRSADRNEGLLAFAEKRKPRWSGR